MKHFWIRCGVILAAVVVFVPGSGLSAEQRGTPDPAEWTLEQLHEGYRVDPGTRVVIDNPWGNVRIREVPLDSGLDVTVNVQHTTDWQRTPVIMRKDSKSGSLVVSLAGKEGDLAMADGRMRADFTVAIPNNMSLAVSMESGDFTMHEATYPVVLRAREGDFNVRTSGEVEININAGHLVYHPPKGSDPAGGRIQTSAADVDVLLSTPDMVNFSIISGAAVTTDSPTILESRTREGRSWEFNLKQQAGRLDIQTDTGRVRLVAEGFR